MPNGVRIRGVSGDVSSVSVQSSVTQTWALLGKKWAGLAWRTHEITLQRDELVVLKCHGGRCVLELTALNAEHGPTIAQHDVSRKPLPVGDRQRLQLDQGQAICLTTATIQHPYHRQGAIVET